MAKISHRTLLRRLNTLGKAIDTHVYAVNSGGCGVMAYHAAHALTKLGIEAEVVTPVYRGLDDTPAVVSKNVKNINDAREWSDNGLSRYHLAVRFKSNGRMYTWDSDSLYTTNGQSFSKIHTCAYPFGEGLTLEHAKGIAASKVGWNSTFDRRQIPTIRKLTKKHLLLK